MIEITCGILIAVSLYLLLEPNLYRKVLGLILLSNVINLAILLSGKLKNIQPAFISNNSSQLSNPLPQALILTAIVIGFGLLAVLCALMKNLFVRRDANNEP